MIALGSAALLVGYLLLFAAVTGHEYTRNPLLALTGSSSSGSGSSTPPGVQGPLRPTTATGPRVRPGSQTIV